MSTPRGLVIPLTPQQIVNRWLYLAGQKRLADLDQYVRKEDGASPTCPELYYLLEQYNGGKDPTAPDPADRWSAIGHPFVNRTADCVAAVAWGGGWDRYQPQRFSHLYDGWINCNSMRDDAGGPQRCFRRIARPEPGCMVVYASDPHGLTHGIAVGHVGGVTSYSRADWDERDRSCWASMDVVNISAQGAGRRANLMTTGATWWRKDAWFVVSTMQPATTPASAQPPAQG